jgi:hypothetical protein
MVGEAAVVAQARVVNDGVVRGMEHVAVAGLMAGTRRQADMYSR